MKILVVEPGKKPEPREIDGSLKSMQEIVGGTIEAIYPWDDSAALICNDEGKLLGLPLNRTLADEDGHIWDVVAGAFFLCGIPADSDSFGSLSCEQFQKYQKLFASPETILNLNGQLVVIREACCDV